MKNKSSWNSFAVNATIILAILLSLSSLLGGSFVTLPLWPFIFVVLGTLVGVLYNIKEVSTLLLIALTLIVIGSTSLEIIPYLGVILRNIISYFTYFIAPLALAVALRKAYELLN